MKLEDEIKFYHRIGFKILLGVVLFITFIELILLVLSITDRERQLVNLRNEVYGNVRACKVESPAQVMSDELIEKKVSSYQRNIILMVVVIVITVSSGMYFLVRIILLRPILKMYSADKAYLSGDAEKAKIDESEFPKSEIGVLMRTRQETIDSLELAVDAAQKASEAKSQFLANMSHELRTPLNAVIGFSDSLKQEVFGKLTDEQKEYLGYILESGKHLLSLINDILDLSKVEAGKMDLQLSDITLEETMKNVLIMFKEQAHNQRIELSMVTKDEIGVIKADDRKFKQILFNIISNAIKFTPEGGEITIESGMYGNGECVYLSVLDSGIGIAKEDYDKVFEEFYQIDNQYTRKFKGTGLGMPLTKKLVELHGGTIWFESEGHGKGTKFTFTLPLT